MGSFSLIHWLVVIVAVVVLFGGRGRLSSIMGDVAKGVTAFRKGLKDEETRKEDLVNVTPPKKDDSAPS